MTTSLLVEDFFKKLGCPNAETYIKPMTHLSKLAQVTFASATTSTWHT